MSPFELLLVIALAAIAIGLFRIAESINRLAIRGPATTDTSTDRQQG